jgi:Ca2+-transporting ATPase
MGVFQFKPSQLRALVDHKSIDYFESLGGIYGLEKALRTSLKDGLNESGCSGDGIPERQRAYLSNVLDQHEGKTLLQLMRIACTDKIILLIGATVILLALGIFQATGVNPGIVVGQPETQVRWAKGAAIVAAVTLVIMVGALNDYQQERRKKLDAQRGDRSIKVVRGGVEKLVNVHDIVVGDVCQIEPDEIIPVDGVFIQGRNVRCDESSTTGESGAVCKASYNEALGMHNRAKQEGRKAKADCFILSGSKVLEGNGTYVAICVGRHSILGGIMTCLSARACINCRLTFLFQPCYGRHQDTPCRSCCPSSNGRTTQNRSTSCGRRSGPRSHNQVQNRKPPCWRRYASNSSNRTAHC